MAKIYPDINTIHELRVPATEGELYILKILISELDDNHEIFFNPYLDGDRPDIVILKKECGAIIIEVKDWNLKNYSISKEHVWSVYSKDGNKYIIKSPYKQVTHYKNNFFDLHFPKLGIAEAINKNFYKIIKTFVYYHNSKSIDIENIFSGSENEIKNDIKQINNLFKLKQVEYEEYSKKNLIYGKMKSKIDFYKNFTITQDTLEYKVKKLSLSKNLLFSNEIYDEFKRRLLPPTWTYEQIKDINFDNIQTKYVESKDGFLKIKGVSGSGKTSILSLRGINAFKRHGNVLILTYNITLKQIIREKIGHLNFQHKEKVDYHRIEISTYHRFFIDQLNNLNISIDIPKNKKEHESFWNTVVSNENQFKKYKTIKYDTVFIDEVQDYQKEWIKIIRDNFLTMNGEMVLFGDEAQNIYQREGDTQIAPVVRGFGSWKKISKSYRLKEKSILTGMFKNFQKEFLEKKYFDMQILEMLSTPNVLYSKNHIVYEKFNKIDYNNIFKKINIFVKTLNIHPNDITILSSKILILENLNDFFENQESTHTMFPTKSELEMLNCFKKNSEEYERRKNSLAKRKKNFFMQNSGKIKLSTIHSFKGMEANTVVCIFDGTESPELVYTAITRAKENLIIFCDESCVFDKFFKYNSTNTFSFNILLQK